MSSPDWDEVTQQLDALYDASEGLEARFPGRKFNLDGHLVGSVGEVVAAYMLGLDLMPASTLGLRKTASCGYGSETEGPSPA